MGNKLSNVISFIIGSAIGGFVMYKILDKKYRQLANDEINEVKKYYKNKSKKEDINEILNDYVVEETKEDPDIQTYKQIISNQKYDSKSEIYVIAPEEYGETDFKMESLTYYADKVLAFNLNNKVIKNIAELIGEDSLNTFGEYEDDSVFVRNEKSKTDYEILLDTRKYSDVVSANTKPHIITNDN